MRCEVELLPQVLLEAALPLPNGLIVQAALSLGNWNAASGPAAQRPSLFGVWNAPT
jgi:hypothetical protein